MTVVCACAHGFKSASGMPRATGVCFRKRIYFVGRGDVCERRLWRMKRAKRSGRIKAIGERASHAMTSAADSTGYVPAVCRNYRLRTNPHTEIATTSVCTGLAMTNKVALHVIARLAEQAVAISCRHCRHSHPIPDTSFCGTGDGQTCCSARLPDAPPWIAGSFGSCRSPWRSGGFCGCSMKNPLPA